ncbi:hypothetical protein GGR52DRAFT_4495 [Hypoxylon sp. FL1284]|nr:hypothetical protein GGR52DRAFT_4495 [Hypoxylon sp. FL1284]
MGVQRLGPSRNIPLLLLLVIAVFVFFRHTGIASVSDRFAVVEMPGSDDVIPKLQVSVRQVSASPPKLGIAVTNVHAGPVTILTWNSPLDPLALQLGLLAFTPAGSDGPVDTPTVQVRRKMPPGADSLVTIAAGQTREQELELRDPVVPVAKLRGTVSVVCRGEWTSVWPSGVDGISQASLESAGAGEDSFKGSFQSEAVNIEV